MCQYNTKDTTIESNEFQIFRDQFYGDSIFQTNHIYFPMKGLDSAQMEYDDSIYVWKNKAHWKFRSDPLKEKDIILNITASDTIIEELYNCDGGGYWELLRFKKTNKDWFLIYYEIVY
jgi:hypothetical protein